MDLDKNRRMQQENVDRGRYQVSVVDQLSNRPVENARVKISYTGDPDSVIEELVTNSSGRTPVIELKTPPLEYSMEPVEQQPYAEYTVQIDAEGCESEEVAGSEVLPQVLSSQPVMLAARSVSEYHALLRASFLLHPAPVLQPVLLMLPHCRTFPIQNQSSVQACCRYKYH